jgi:hypothetical protein
MDQHDTLNLIFLIEASKETLLDWWHNTSDDDHEYAMELLARYSALITEKQDNLGNPYNWTESQGVLGKIMYEM